MLSSGPDFVAIGRLLDDVPNPDLVRVLVEVVSQVSRVLKQAGTLELDRYELDPELERGLPVWLEVEADIAELLRSLGETAEHLTGFFPPTPTMTDDLVDLGLAMALEDASAHLPSPMRDHLELRLDDAVKRARAGRIDGLPDVLGELGARLGKIAVEHTQRLEMPALRESNTELLGELHELRTRSARTLEAIVAAIVVGISNQPLHALFPRFYSGGARAARIRAWATELAADLERLPNLRVAFEPSLTQAVELIDRAGAGPEVEWLRASDRSEFQGFRRWLREADQATPEEAAGRLADLTVWVRLMERINRRRILAAWDLEAMKSVLALQERGVEGSALLTALEALYGRDERLDEMIREAREGRAPDAAEVSALMQTLRSVVSSYA